MKLNETDHKENVENQQIVSEETKETVREGNVGSDVRSVKESISKREYERKKNAYKDAAADSLNELKRIFDGENWMLAKKIVTEISIQIDDLINLEDMDIEE